MDQNITGYLIIKKKEFIEFWSLYVDKYNSSHRRNINLKKNELNINDDIRALNKNAILRWRLISDDWK